MINRLNGLEGSQKPSQPSNDSLTTIEDLNMRRPSNNISEEVLQSMKAVKTQPNSIKKASYGEPGKKIGDILNRINQNNP